MEYNWVVVSNIFYFHPYWGKIPILTNISQRGWNHQLDEAFLVVNLWRSILMFYFWFLQKTTRTFIARGHPFDE